ncbi:MAG: acylneuraminate cytidylyltransferase family protein [bacterium]|nr:acylneuraminate cytidylyltransferase family protein [bacterium]
MVVAIITARANSKGLPGKNMMDLGGMPLIEHSMKVACESAEFDAVILSTDLIEAINLAKEKYPKIEVPFVRPENLCGDTTTHVEVINHLCDYFESENRKVDYLVLLQPTTPFRLPSEMNEGVSLLKNGASSVLGVTPVMHHPADYLYKNKAGKIEYIMPDFKATRRQDFPTVYFNNGAFYGCSLTFFKSTQSFFDSESELLVMSENSLFDIDTAFDMKLARAIIA